MGRFIGEALESLGRQTYAAWEVIVVDDCGPDDGTRDVVERFAANHVDRNVVYVRHEVNQGVCAARRTGVAHAQGKYVAFLDPDDFFQETKLATHAGILDDNSACVLVHSSACVIGHDVPPDRTAYVERFHSLYPERVVYHLPQTRNYLQHNMIVNSTVMCRRSALQTDFFPNDWLFQLEDWYLWNRLGDQGMFCFDPEPLTTYRLHGAGHSASVLARPGAMALAKIEMLSKMLPCLTPRRQQRALAQIAECLAHLQAQGGADGSSAVPIATTTLLSRFARQWAREMAAVPIRRSKKLIKRALQILRSEKPAPLA
jgi:glycosyltransferase involved in cell wall biosynthesis